MEIYAEMQVGGYYYLQDSFSLHLQLFSTNSAPTKRSPFTFTSAWSRGDDSLLLDINVWRLAFG